MRSNQLSYRAAFGRAKVILFCNVTNFRGVVGLNLLILW
jgi:hypothetical protein